MERNCKSIQKGLSIQLTKLEQKFNLGVLSHISEALCQNIESKLCDLYDCDDTGLVYQTELGRRFMHLRMAVVEQANEALSSQTQVA